MCVTHITEYRSADETRLWGHAHSMALAVSELVWPRPHTVKQDFIQIGKHTRIPVMIYNDIRSQRRHSRKIPMSILKKLASCDYFGILNWICLFNIFLPRLQQLSLMLTLRKPHIKHPCFKNKFIIDLARVWCYVNSCGGYNMILVLHYRTIRLGQNMSTSYISSNTYQWKAKSSTWGCRSAIMYHVLDSSHVLMDPFRPADIVLICSWLPNGSAQAQSLTPSLHGPEGFYDKRQFV